MASAYSEEDKRAAEEFALLFVDKSRMLFRTWVVRGSFQIHLPSSYVYGASSNKPETLQSFITMCFGGDVGLHAPAPVDGRAGGDWVLSIERLSPTTTNGKELLARIFDFYEEVVKGVAYFVRAAVIQQEVMLPPFVDSVTLPLSSSIVGLGADELFDLVEIVRSKDGFPFQISKIGYNHYEVSVGIHSKDVSHIQECSDSMLHLFSMRERSRMGLMHYIQSILASSDFRPLSPDLGDAHEAAQITCPSSKVSKTPLSDMCAAYGPTLVSKYYGMEMEVLSSDEGSHQWVLRLPVDGEGRDKFYTRRIRGYVSSRVRAIRNALFGYLQSVRSSEQASIERLGYLDILLYTIKAQNAGLTGYRIHALLSRHPDVGKVELVSFRDAPIEPSSVASGEDSDIRAVRIYFRQGT